MSAQRGLENVTAEESRNNCSEELLRAIERNRLEMEIAWIRSEDHAGVLDSTLYTHLTILAKYFKSK